MKTTLAGNDTAIRVTHKLQSTEQTLVFEETRVGQIRRRSIEHVKVFSSAGGALQHFDRCRLAQEDFKTL